MNRQVKWLTLLLIAACGEGAQRGRSPEDVDGGLHGRGDAGSQGDTDASAACESLLRERPMLAACVTSSLLVDRGAQADGSPRWSLDLEGKVVAYGAGDAPERCFGSETAIGEYIRGQAEALADARWLRLEDADGNEVVVGLAADGLELGLAAGDVVKLSFRSRPEPFAPSISNLTVRSGEDALLASFAFGGDVPDLLLPGEFSAEPGPVRCTLKDSCVEGAELLDLTVRVDDQQRTLRFGERANVGGFEVVHGGLARQTGASTCPDAYVAWAGLAAWAGQP